MNPQIESLIKSALISAGTSIAVKYGLDQNLVPAIVGGLLAAATAGWALWSRRQQGIINSAAKVATQITAPKALADNAPDNVVASETHVVVSK